MKKLFTKTVLVILLGGCINNQESKLQKIMDDSSKVYIEKGDSCMREGGYEKAIEYFNRAIILNPRYISAYFERALWYTLGGHAYKEAIEDYTTILAICPSDYHDEYKRNQDSIFREAY